MDGVVIWDSRVRRERRRLQDLTHEGAVQGRRQVGAASGKMSEYRPMVSGQGLDDVELR